MKNSFCRIQVKVKKKQQVFFTVNILFEQDHFAIGHGIRFCVGHRHRPAQLFNKNVRSAITASIQQVCHRHLKKNMFVYRALSFDDFLPIKIYKYTIIRKINNDTF